MNDSVTTLLITNKTGKTWHEWHDVVHACGKTDLHEIIAHLRETYNLDPQWAQLIAMRYRHKMNIQ